MKLRFGVVEAESLSQLILQTVINENFVISEVIMKFIENFGGKDGERLAICYLFIALCSRVAKPTH